MSSTTCNTDWGPTPDDPRPIQSRAAGPATTSRPRDVFLRRILAAHPTKFGHILENAEQYRFQVLLSVPSEGEDCRTDFKRHDFRADAEYFYPARYDIYPYDICVSACETAGSGSDSCF